MFLYISVVLRWYRGHAVLRKEQNQKEMVEKSKEIVELESCVPLKEHFTEQVVAVKML